MKYRQPTISTEKLHPITSLALSVTNLLASCSGSCTEPGYKAYPNYVQCVSNDGNYDIQFGIFLPGNNIGSQANLLSACNILINGTPIDESTCKFYTATACGNIGFTYFLSCNALGNCPTTTPSVTLSCSDVQTEGPCTYIPPA